MRAVIFVLICIITLLMLIAYCLCVIAHEADERAERMYRKWLEEKNE